MNIVIRKRRFVGGADVTAPVISAISATAGVGASWTTDEPSDSQVAYGGGSGTGYEAAVLASTPIAYWRLGEGSGTSAAEEIGTATGAYVATPTLGAASLIPSDAVDTAVTFASASTQYVNIPSNMPAGASAGFSVEMWVKPTTDLAIGDYRMFSWGVIGTTAHHMLVYRRFDSLTWGYTWFFSDGAARSTTASFTTSAGAQRIDDGSAHHVVAVHDYGGKTLKIYRDAVLSTQCTKDLAAFAVPTAIAAGTAARIAAYMGNTLSLFDGTVDEVAVYNSALSQATIETHNSAALASGGEDYETAIDPTLVTTHNVSIPSLEAGWTYVVKSRDAAGNLATSADQTVPAVVSGTLQDIIDGATAGSTVNLSGLTFYSNADVNKALTLVGGTVKLPLGVRGLTVSASNVTLDGMTILGSQTNNYASIERGIYVYSSISGLTVKNCTVGDFGMAGMWLDGATSIQIDNNEVYNCGYVGIAGLSSNGGYVEDNHVHDIGVGYTTGGASFPNNNAYGIVFMAQRTITTMSRDVITRNNLIDHVPVWHGLDTHGGIDLTFSGNTIRRTSRPIFITGHDDSGTNYNSIRIAVTGNRVESPSPITYNLRAIFFTSSVDCSATGNWISSVYPITGDFPANPADNRVDAYGTNSGLVVNSNILI